MLELNEKAVEAAVLCYSEGGCFGLDERERRDVVTDIITAYISSLPAPDDGLVESLSEDSIHAIRELLGHHGVPTAAFIDDHVANAIVQRNQECDRAGAAEQQVQKLTAENERLREALSFYADPKNYKGEFVPGGRSERGTYVLEHHINLVRKDAGTIARSALETQEGGE